jgi:hypothetical protein
VSTSPDLRTHQVTVINMQGIPVDLVPLPSNVWSLQGLLPGIYTLDVIVDMSSSAILGTYETVLVVLEPNQQPLPPTTIISQITVEESEVCPPNLILVNGNCIEPKPPSPMPPTKPTDSCDDPTTRDLPLLGIFCPKDGGEQPPCPEGIEANWCQDEDERQDTDDCLRPDCSERFPCRGDEETLRPEIIDEDDTPAPEEPEEGETLVGDDDTM